MAQRIVVKIGSRLITEQNGKLSPKKLTQLTVPIAKLHEAGHQVICVSSGAIAAGFERLGYVTRPTSTADRQASAAVGQGLLLESYARAFQKFSITVAQVLLTRKDFTMRDSYNNALRTLVLLLEKRALPIINENDTVAVEEIKFGDNDVLAGLLAGLLHADHLFLLTDIPGLFDSDPHLNPDAKPIPFVDEITPEIEALAGDSVSEVGTGGMRSKIEAARRALSLGVKTFIGTATEPEALLRVLEKSGNGTYFGEANSSTLGRKRQWIAFHSECPGRIFIDTGAVEALVRGGKSLLPVGVQAIEGDFQAQEVVEVLDPNHHVIGKGVVLYSRDELEKVRGKNTTEIGALLGDGHAEVIHRDNWVLLRSPSGLDKGENNE